MNMSGKIYLPENSLFVRKKDLFAPLTNLAALALLVAVLCLTVTKNATVNLIWTCSVFALMAASLNITMGFMGQLALGHMGFMAVGAYLGTLVANCFKGSGVFSSASDAGYLPVFFFCILAGGVGAALIGFVVGMPALRLKGDYLAIITLGFGLIVTNVLNNIAGSVLYREKCGLYITGKLQVKFLPLIVLIAAGCLALMYNFIHSRYGRALKSIRDDYAYWLDIVKLEQVAYGNQKILASYRVLNNSTTGNKKKLIKKQYQFYRGYLKLSALRSLMNTFRWGINGLRKYHG